MYYFLKLIKKDKLPDVTLDRMTQSKRLGLHSVFLCKRFITYTDWNKMNDDISENIMKVFPVTHTAEMYSQQQIFSK